MSSFLHKLPLCSALSLLALCPFANAQVQQHWYELSATGFNVYGLGNVGGLAGGDFALLTSTGIDVYEGRDGVLNWSVAALGITHVAGAGFDYSGDGVNDVMIAFGDRVEFYSQGTMTGRIWAPSLASGFGQAMTSIGDFDGTFGPEILIASPQANQLTGSAYVYRSSDAATIAAPGLPLPFIVHNGIGQAEEFGTSVSVVGDLTGNGSLDYAIAAPGPSGGSGRVDIFDVDPVTLTITQVANLSDGVIGGFFGQSISGLDLLGTPRLAVGAPFASGGTVYVYDLLTLNQDLAISAWQDSSGAPISEGLGWRVGAMADLDGDGLQDVIASAPDRNVNGASAGAISVLSSVDGSTLQEYNGMVANERLGLNYAIPGDVNFDGNFDIVTRDTNQVIRVFLSGPNPPSLPWPAGRPMLGSSPSTVPAATSTTITYTLDTNGTTAVPNDLVFMIGGFTGTYPGFANVPLNYDSYTQVMLENPVIATVGANGMATLSITTPPLPSLRGTTVHHACLVFSADLSILRTVSQPSPVHFN